MNTNSTASEDSEGIEKCYWKLEERGSLYSRNLAVLQLYEKQNLDMINLNMKSGRFFWFLFDAYSKMQKFRGWG